MNNVKCIDYYTADDQMITSVNFNPPISEDLARIFIEHEAKHDCEYGEVFLADGEIKVFFA